ncbi:MAG: hypothetical protein PHT79_03870 [Syntrophomonadaceae bacterium]|nr:hypothetical protein [Syntrophomonadaceae bacterium]MDD3888376.1 hypothetical protein [Syntrophomonadaceae bacterium]MDD4548881.1 hypothetical protein [Syntrophomonadaceae bacterium]
MDQKNLADNEIRKALEPALKQLLYQHYIKALGLGFTVGAVLVVLLISISYLKPIPQLYYYCAGVLAAAFTVAFIIAYIYRPDFKTAAYHVDACGLKERITTAIEAAGNNSTMARKQRLDALGHLKDFNASEHLPVRFPTQEIRVGGVATLLIIVLLLLPNPMDVEVERQKQVTAAVSQQVEKITQIKKELEKKQEEVPLASREELIKTLENLEGELRDAKTLSDSVRSVSKAEEKLQELKKSGATPAEDNIRQMVDSLQKLEMTHQLGNKIAEGDTKASREETADLLQKFSRNKNQDVHNAGTQLQQEANTLADSNLGTVLQSLGSAAKQGNASANQGASLQNQIASISSQAGLYNDLNTSLAALGNARQQIIAAQGNANLASNSGTAGQGGQANTALPGNSNKQGSSGMPGANGTQGSNNSGSGSGSGSGAGAGDGDGKGTGTGTGIGAGKGAGTGSGAGMGEGGESESSQGTSSSAAGKAGGELAPLNQGEYEKIFDPRRVGQAGATSYVKGKGNDGPEEIVETADPAIMSAAVCPYQEVIGHYSAAARESLNRSVIPAGMQDMVRDYFATLEE